MEAEIYRFRKGEFFLMKLSVLANLFKEKSLEETLAVTHALGVTSVEVACCGGLCDTTEMLSDKVAFYQFRETFNAYDTALAALSFRGNPVHPSREQAARFDTELRRTILVAELLGLDTVVTVSGCPGDKGEGVSPNWVSYARTEEAFALLDYQWNELLVPYWKELVAFAREHGVKHIAIEMAPGNCVFNPETLLRLRAEVGEEIGAAVNPAELLCQGIDPVIALRVLADVLCHVYIQDLRIDAFNCAQNGLCENKRPEALLSRSFAPRTVGYGDIKLGDLLSTLSLIGYNGPVTLVQNDLALPTETGLAQALQTVTACGAIER